MGAIRNTIVFSPFCGFPNFWTIFKCVYFVFFSYFLLYLDNKPNFLDQFHQPYFAHPRDSIHRGFIPQRAQRRELLRGNGESVEGRIVPSSPRGSYMPKVETWIPVRASR